MKKLIENRWEVVQGAFLKPVYEEEDVNEFVKKLWAYAEHQCDWELKSLLKEWTGFALSGLNEVEE